MKLALIAQPRCGTNSILFYISDILKNYVTYGEPFNYVTYSPTIEYNKIISHTNVFMKTMFNQTPIEMDGIDKIDFILKVVSDFDHAVFLTRRDLEKQTESLASAVYENRWISQYVYNKKSHSLHDEIKKNLEIDQISLINLSKQLNKKVYYYEDIYFDNDEMKRFLNDLGVNYNHELFGRWLDKSKKYRVEIDNQNRKLI